MNTLAFAKRTATSTGFFLATIVLAGCGGSGDDRVVEPANYTGVWVEERDTDGDGLANDRNTGDVTFAADGSVARLASEWDAGNDSIIDESFERTYTNGSITSATFSVDADGDGVFDTVYLSSYSYDAAGHRTQMIAEQRDGAGTLTSRSTEDYVPDADGNTLSEVRVDDQDGDGTPEYRYSTSNTYAGGHVVASSHRSYVGTAPDPSYVVETTCTYEGDLRLGCTASFDQDGDGTEDVREVETNTYDAQGHQLSYSRVRTSAYSNSSQSYIFTYDASGRAEAAFGSFDNDGDGVPNWTIAYRYGYDAAGNEATNIAEWDDGGDGVVESRSGYFRTFDAAGNVLSETYKSGLSPDDSSYTEMTVETYAYDSAGIRLLTSVETDLDGNGTIDEMESHTIARDDRGLPLSKLSTFDTNNDGTPEITETVTATWPTSIIPDLELLADITEWYR